MNIQIFNNSKLLITASDLEIAESIFEEDTNNWSITLNSIKRVKIKWNHEDNYFSVHELDINKDTGSVTTDCIFASKLSSENDVLATLKDILNAGER